MHPALDIAQGVDHFSHTLASNILEGTGGHDIRDLAVQYLGKVRMLPAQSISDRLYALRTVQNFGSRVFSGLQNRIKLFGRPHDPVCRWVIRLKSGNFTPRLSDMRRKLLELPSQYLYMRFLVNLRLLALFSHDEPKIIQRYCPLPTVALP